MGFTPNRIVLISRGRHDEFPCDADVYPGMVLLHEPNGNVIPHNVAGGVGEFLICKEEPFLGLDITQKIPSGGIAPVQRPAKGDEFLMLLQNGQNVAQGVPLMSAGDGTLVPSPGTPLYQIVAPSAVITNTAVETTFSNGSFAIPANTLQPGDVVHIRGKVTEVAQNAADTQRVRVYIGTAPITLADSAARALAAGDFVFFDIYLTVRTITAAGTVIASAVVTYSVAGAVTDSTQVLASTTLDSTVAETINVKALASAANVGDQIRLDEFRVELLRGAGLNTLVYSAEAVNNSGGTGTSGFNSAAFIRCWVP